MNLSNRKLQAIKEKAYDEGYRSGEIDTRAALEVTWKQRELAAREREKQYRALSDICQTGTTVVECMSKALLSIRGNL